MSTEPMMALLRADRRAAELRNADLGDHSSGRPSVLQGAATHSGAYLLRALEEEGWELRPIIEGLEPSAALAERVVGVAHHGVGLDDIHRSLSPAVVLAALQSIEAAGLVVMEGETR